MKHAVERHDGREDVPFSMKIVRKFYSALPRMIGEAVRISRKAESTGAELLNSKGEFSRCRIPRLVVKFGQEEGSDCDRGKQKCDESKNVTFRESKERSDECQKKASSNTKRNRQTGFQSPSIISFFESCSPDYRKRERVKSSVT